MIYSKSKAVSLMANTIVAIITSSQMIVLAQAGDNNSPVGQVSMAIFPVQKGDDGQQYIITKAGYRVTVPGLGIASNANEIAVYRDEGNHYWYVDRNGATQAVTQSQLDWTMRQISEQQQRTNVSGSPAMYATQPAQPGLNGQVQTNATPGSSSNPTVIIQNQQPTSQGNSAAGSAAVTGMAAMGGAMAGSAIADSMYNHNSGYGSPYGVPCYNDNGHKYYTGANGERVPINSSANNSYDNQWNNQSAYQDNKQNRQNQYDNMNPNQQQTLKNMGKEGYSNRQTAKTSNPSSASGSSGGSSEKRSGRHYR